ncbi:MAG: hypothetical protein KAJ51_10955, partial [Thermoplasmata archaeon]|nr:hypothetical protein [Thermoplasmata archaeon]
WSGTDFLDTGLRGQTLSSSNTLKGELWTCEVIPHDGLKPGSTVLSSITVTILNSQPSVSDVRITPESPTTAQALNTYYEYSDLDGDPELGSEIKWFRNDQYVPALDNQFTVPYTMTSKGQVWNFSLRPYDNYDYGDWVGSEFITIQNNPPYSMNLTITPNPPLGDDSFTAHYTFYDDDGDTDRGYQIKWYMNGIHQTLFDDMLEVDSTATGKGELWYFSLSVYDGEDWSAEVDSHYVAIENSKPVVSTLQPTPGQIVLNEMESVEFQVDANDPDGDLLLYKWRLDKTSVSDDEYYLLSPDYDGAGTFTLNLTIQDVGEKSYTLAYEWNIVVNNVNRNPQLDVLEPLTKDPKMKEDTSLKFRIDESDPDSEDTLDITWYFDDVVAQEGGSSYTYHADFAAAGDHEVKVVVDD